MGITVKEAIEAKKRQAARGGASDPIPSQPVTPEDEALLEGAESPQAPSPEEDEELNGIPEWAIIPEGFKKPKKGKQIYFVQFLASWTETPEKGNRHCVMTNLSEADEKVARQRAQGDSVRTVLELARQMIRANDGVLVDWSRSKKEGNPDIFWREIGYKCRQEIASIFLKTHVLSEEQRSIFFAHCVRALTVAD